MWKVYSVERTTGYDYCVDEFATRAAARAFARDLRARLAPGWHTRVEDWRDPQWEAWQHSLTDNVA